LAADARAPRSSVPRARPPLADQNTGWMDVNFLTAGRRAPAEATPNNL